MPPARHEKLIADKYALDYYRRPLATRLWKRRWNWLALLIALLATAALYLVLRDRAFYAGPISPAHVAAGATCKDCHDRSWQPALRLATASSDLHSVSDAACRECHQVADHHETLGFVGHACATCHQEHRGGAKLSDVTDGQCVTCHGNLAELKQAKVGFYTKIERFSTGAAEHPEFALLGGGAAPGEAHGASRVARFDSSAGGRWLDAGGVKFNHKVHLAAEGVLDADRQPVKLQCAECHVEDGSGAYMAPIDYQQHCATCHPLRLAGRFESLGELPHREPEIVRAVIRERLARESASAEADSPAGSPGDSRRIPLLPKPVGLSVDQAKTVEELLAQAEHAVLGLEAKGMCRKCHHVVADADRWKVLRQPPEMVADATDGPAPTMIPHRWLQHGRFDHANHRAVACEKCHQVAHSELTADILLPSISTCRECHGAAVTTMAEGVGGRCVMCHDFHSER